MASHVLRSTHRGASAPFAELRQRLRDWQAKRRQQAQIARELATYTPHDLCDLGITSGDIPAIIQGTYRRT
jgi:uncharacterized protein YjiS (DUF1127 family)